MSTPNLPALRAQGEIALSGLAEQIDEKHQAVIDGLRTSLAAALDAGDLLERAKAEAGHGQFGEWVERYCKCSYRTARWYMQFARRRHVIEAAGCGTITEAAKFASGMLPPAQNGSGAQTGSRCQNEPAAPVIRPGRATHHDIMHAWLNASDDERTAFIDSIGLSGWSSHVPAVWLETAARRSAVH